MEEWLFPSPKWMSVKRPASLEASPRILVTVVSKIIRGIIVVFFLAPFFKFNEMHHFKDIIIINKSDVSVSMIASMFAAFPAGS